jgi:tyrosinase
MYAMFEALYPDSYVRNEPNADGTFTEEPGYTETVTSNLTPFWKDNSTFYTSQTAKSTTQFGYCYPETQSWNYSTTALYQKSIQAALKKLYGTTISSSGAIPLPALGTLTAVSRFQQVNGAANGKPIPPSVPSREINAEKSSESSGAVSTDGIDIESEIQHEDVSLLSKIGDKIKNATAKAGPLVQQDNGSVMNTLIDGALDSTAYSKHKEWIINIRVQKHCLRGPFSIHCFLGPVPSSTSSWLTHANNVGTCSILGSDRTTTSCDKCKTDADRNLIVTGVVMLTDALYDELTKGNLQSLMPADVEPYLARMLHWRVTQVGPTCLLST